MPQTGRRRLSGTCDSGRRSIPAVRTAHTVWRRTDSRRSLSVWFRPLLSLRSSGINFLNDVSRVVLGSFFPYITAMPVTVDHIIERLGGPDAAARLTGVGTEAVRKWRQSRAIPSRHWPAVIAATGLSMADLHTASPHQASATMPQATDSVPAGAPTG